MSLPHSPLPPITKRCTTCTRFRAYHPDDRHCIVCGSDSLVDRCRCGREFDYALAEEGELHCPRCGRPLRGRSEEFDD
jgi:hypothetical protein